MGGLYALIIYCTGNCLYTFPPPTSVLLYHSMAGCSREAVKMYELYKETKILGPNGKELTDIKFQVTCAVAYLTNK